MAAWNAKQSSEVFDADSEAGPVVTARPPNSLKQRKTSRWIYQLFLILQRSWNQLEPGLAQYLLYSLLVTVGPPFDL